MSDNEYERFEISDYDLANEFNPNRPRRRQTRNQQIYGIWADDSENDSEEETSNRRGRRGLGGGGGGNNKDYTAPVSFVAGGVHQIGKKNKEKEKNAITDEDDDGNNDDDHNNVEEDVRPSFGRKPAQIMESESPNSSDNSSDENERRKRTTSTTPPSSTQSQQPSSTQRSGFGSNNANIYANNPNLGTWEQHTRGIGAKLLLQMGYKPGKGLGKDLQGISQPVQAHVRKGRGAIGAYGPEKSATVNAKLQKSNEDGDLREIKENKEKQNKWKKDARTDKQRYIYRTVEEVIEKGKKNTSILSNKLSKTLSNVPVIDMTGPEKRVLSGYHALAQSKITEEDLYEDDTIENNVPNKIIQQTNFALPELKHNLQLIVNMCEQDIIALDKTEREANDKYVSLEYERANLEEVTKLEKQHIITLEKALALVDELTDDSCNLTLERAEKIFLELQKEYAAEYKEFALCDLAAGVIAPLLKITLSSWQPLENQTQHIDTVKKWRTILDYNKDTQNETRNIFDPYSTLVWAGVIPSFRACAASWNPKQHQIMAALLDSWAPLFPSWILDSVLEQLILPQLSNGVREWDPLTDTVPIHIWILPWNAILGHKMEEFIYPTIREKLGAALQAWMPQDRSARAMLTPWKNAFDDGEMQLFLLKHVIPKLQIVLNDFIINPMQQDLEPWNQVWEWHELIPTIQMGQLLDKYFFPKWMQVLVLWLNQAPDYGEISRWYTGWKNMLSEEILREPNIKEHLRRALEMMHRATETVLPPTIGIVPNISTPLPPQPPQPPPALMDLHVQAPAQLVFKELVAQKCAERGVLFAPMPGRRELGKQIYRAGKIFCYIDRNVCMMSDSGLQNWSPASLAQLLDRAINI